MRRFLTLVVLTTVACAKPAVDVAAAQKSLHERSAGLQAAEAAMDEKRALAFWAADGIVQAPGSPQIQGHDAIAGIYHQYFTSGMLKSLDGTSSQLVMAASGDLAYETGINKMVLKGPNGELLDMGKFLLVWKLEQGTWVAAALSFTSDAPAPVPLTAVAK